MPVPVVSDEPRVITITEAHVEGFWSAVDAVARERRWLAGVEAYPLEATREFVRDNLAKGFPQFVALTGERVVAFAALKTNCTKNRFKNY